MREVRTVVEDVPREGEGAALARWDDAVVASLDDPGATAPGEVTTEIRIYRRPLERRAHGTADLVDIVRDVVAEQLTERFGSDD